MDEGLEAGGAPCSSCLLGSSGFHLSASHSSVCRTWCRSAVSLVNFPSAAI